MTRSQITLSQVLKAYRRDRVDVVIARDRLNRAIARLQRAMGRVNARDRAAVARAVTRYTASRRRGGAAASTIARELIVLRAAMMMQWKAGRIERTYVALPHVLQPRQRWLRPDELRQLSHHIDPRLDIFWALAVHTGARLGAILDLTWDRVDLDGGYIDYRAPHPKQERRKNRASVPIVPPLRKVLRRAHQQRCNDPRVVQIGASTIRRLLARAAAEAGIPHVYPHALRHTVATWLLGESSQVPLIKTSRLLGHRSVAVTEQVYAHIIARHLSGAAEAVADMIEES